MTHNTETLASHRPQPASDQPRGLDTYGVYVLPALGNGRILTREDGAILRGRRVIPGGVETDALRTAREYELRSMKAAGPLQFEDAQSRVINGLGYVIEPTLEGRSVNFAELGFETRSVEQLDELYIKLGKAAQTPEAFRDAHRHQILLQAFGNFALRHATRGY